MRVRPLSLTLLVVVSCHPLAPFIPPDLPRDNALVLESKDMWPKQDVTVFTDDLGIPHLYAKHEPDAAYALGVMHGRDRQFQIFLYVHAGEGRLTELLGPDLIEVDRENRILLHDLDNAMNAVAPRDREMIDAYCAGVNQGAAMVGKSAEMNILGVEWEPLTPKKVLAIVRLQQWDQAVGFAEEMARYHVVQALGRDNAVAKSLLLDAPSRGVPIVTQNEHDGAPLDASLGRSAKAALTPRAQPTLAHSTLRPHTETTRASLEDDVAALFTNGGTGS